MSTLIERLEEVMASKGWSSPQQIADVAGVTRSAAAQWLGQGSKIIKTIGKMQAAERLEQETGYRALWIAKGEGPKFVGTKTPPGGDWPFSIDINAYRGLSPEKKEQLDALVRAFVTGASPTRPKK